MQSPIAIPRHAVKAGNNNASSFSEWSTEDAYFKPGSLASMTLYLSLLLGPRLFIMVDIYINLSKVLSYVQS
jgi:hypothetical protein